MLFGWLFPTRSALRRIEHKLEVLVMRADEANQKMDAVNAQLQKIGNESAILLAKVTELQDAAANSELPASLSEKINAVVTQAQAVDDLVPDAEPGVVEAARNR